MSRFFSFIEWVGWELVLAAALAGDTDYSPTTAASNASIAADSLAWYEPTWSDYYRAAGPEPHRSFPTHSPVY